MSGIQGISILDLVGLHEEIITMFLLQQMNQNLWDITPESA
jgi:hypothetical protein